MKTVLKAFLASIAFAVASPAAAQQDMTANQWIRASENGDDYLHFWMLGTLAGFLWMNAEIETTGNQPIFCQPRRMTLTVEQAHSILQNFIKRKPNMGEVPAGAAILLALKDVFPCPAR